MLLQEGIVEVIPGESRARHRLRSAVLVKFRLLDGGNEFIIQPGGKDHFIPL